MMKEHVKNRKSLVKWLVIVLLAVIVLASVTLGAYLYVHSLQQEELRNSLIANCEKNGNPLREVLQHRIQKEIEQSENTALLEGLFPNYPKDKLEALVGNSIKELKEEEVEIKPINCEESYSK